MPTRSKAKSKTANLQASTPAEPVDNEPNITLSLTHPTAEAANELLQPQLSTFINEEATEKPLLPITLNWVNLVGHCGSDPDIRYFESGSVKATISLAVRRRAKDNPPDWFNLEMWANTAEIAANYIRKGDQIGVSGYLKIETWLDSELGVSRSKPIIKVERLYLLGSKRVSDSCNEEE